MTFRFLSRFILVVKITHTGRDAISFKELLTEEWPMGFSVGAFKKIVY